MIIESATHLDTMTRLADEDYTQNTSYFAASLASVVGDTTEKR